MYISFANILLSPSSSVESRGLTRTELALFTSLLSRFLSRWHLPSRQLPKRLQKPSLCHKRPQPAQQLQPTLPFLYTAWVFSDQSNLLLRYIWNLCLIYRHRSLKRWDLRVTKYFFASGFDLFSSYINADVKVPSEWWHLWFRRIL